jgi:hypothetical protein
MATKLSSDEAIILGKLLDLDKRIRAFWVDSSESSLAEEDKWDLFLGMLNSRINLLQLCKDVGIELEAHESMPAWLSALVENRVLQRKAEMGISENQKRIINSSKAYRKVSKLSDREVS